MSMGLRINGDVIEMDGVAVARIAPLLISSERFRFEEAIKDIRLDNVDVYMDRPVRVYKNDTKVKTEQYAKIREAAAQRAQAGMITLGDLTAILEGLK